jgi:hypothetical protein
MRYRETACIICGRKIIDKSTTQTRMYCSEACNYRAFRERHGLIAKLNSPSCTYNIHVQCDMQKCSTCGWNPKVEQRRKEALGCG